MTARKTPVDSFDAFWAEVSGGATETIRSIEVKVPTDVPLALEMRLKDLQDSESEDDIRELVSILFGGDVLDQWRDAGMGLLEFKTVLAWGMAHATGTKVTFREAYDMVVAEEAGEGKAPSGQNRATRRTAAKKTAASARSASTGGRSNPTSRASTASKRTTSRG
ncbi:hypothetical protein [Streptomyces lunaelactis]|uniref:hypothetical protein n=1 Tax=Streptomyces lunaelactis TaxID=1535768 RepID=UPI00158499AA|nr:hypothetical protein [Streptomyces lunaelactis]NUK22073.1 hypothetical protein [Streptomyces lunaelactis]